MKKIIVLLFLALSFTVSAAPFKIPAEDLKGIKEYVAKQHPGDYTTQAFVFDLQKKAYKSLCFFRWDKRVSKKVMNEIITKSVEQSAENDYVTMLFIMKLEMKNYLKLL